MRTKYINTERERAERSLDVPLTEMVPLASIILLTGVSLDSIFHTSYSLTLIGSFIMIMIVSIYRKKRFERIAEEQKNKNLTLSNILP